MPVLVALAVCGTALAVGWGVQAAVLPRPQKAELAAVDALVVLGEHRHVASRIQIAGRPAVSGTCSEGWFRTRGTLLTFENGVTVFDTGHRLVVRGASESTRLAVAQLDLAGCPHVLSDTVARLLQSGEPIRGRRVWFGQPALAVRLVDRPAVLTLYLTPRRFVPIGVSLVGPFVSGRGHFRFVRQ